MRVAGEPPTAGFAITGHNTGTKTKSNQAILGIVAIGSACFVVPVLLVSIAGSSGGG